MKHRLLEEAQEQLIQLYLGKNGVHGFGLRPATETIVVMVEKKDTEAQRKLLDKLKQDALPFRVEEKFESRPKLLRSA